MGTFTSETVDRPEYQPGESGLLPVDRTLSGCVVVISGCPGGKIIVFKWKQVHGRRGRMNTMRVTIDGKAQDRNMNASSKGKESTRRRGVAVGSGVCG